MSLKLLNSLTAKYENEYFYSHEKHISVPQNCAVHLFTNYRCAEDNFTRRFVFKYCPSTLDIYRLRYLVDGCQTDIFQALILKHITSKRNTLIRIGEGGTGFGLTANF